MGTIFLENPNLHKKLAIKLQNRKKAAIFAVTKPTQPVLKKYTVGVEQLVARRAHNPEVVGSSPTPATKK